VSFYSLKKQSIKRINRREQDILQYLSYQVGYSLQIIKNINKNRNPKTICNL